MPVYEGHDTFGYATARNGGRDRPLRPADRGPAAVPREPAAA